MGSGHDARPPIPEAPYLAASDSNAVSENEMVPLALDHRDTPGSDRPEAAWIADRLARASAALGTVVERRRSRLVVRIERGSRG